MPDGFDLGEDGATLVPNEGERAVVQDIGDMREAGKTLKAIADALTERTVTTKTGKSNLRSHSAIARILTR